MQKFLYILIALLTLACKPEAVPTEVADGKLYFGEKIDDNNATGISESVIGFGKGEQRTVKIKGTIESVCQAKGCWMNIVDDSDESVFIKFKDYAFFVPLDATGKEVVVSGVLSNTVTSVEDLRHYAQDGGASVAEIAAITEQKMELKLMADGVIIYE